MTQHLFPFSPYNIGSIYKPGAQFGCSLSFPQCNVYMSVAILHLLVTLNDLSPLVLMSCLDEVVIIIAGISIILS